MKQAPAVPAKFGLLALGDVIGPYNVYLGEIETAVLDALDPPLNLRGRPPTPIRSRADGLRRGHGGDIADTPAPPEPAQPRLPRPGELSLDQAERRFHQARRRPSTGP